MSSDQYLRELLGQPTEGPVWNEPTPPKPYYSCSGCEHYSQSLACSGGLRGSPTYYKSCTHPDVHTDYKNGRSLTTGFHGEPGHAKVVTPSWCPFMDANGEPKEVEPKEVEPKTSED